MTTILIESNRRLSTKSLAEPSTQLDAVDEDDETKGRWNTVLAEQIEVNPGDRISLQSGSINITGADNNMLSFTGATSVPDVNNTYRKDNEAQLSLGYYIQNNMTFNMPLPLARHRVKRTLYKSTFGAPSLNGEFEGNGANLSTDSTDQGYCAGFSAFTAAYPYRAIPGCKYTIDATTGAISNPEVLASPALWQTYNLDGTAYAYREYTPFSKASHWINSPNNERFYLPDRNLYSPYYHPESDGPEADIGTEFEFYTRNVDLKVKAGLLPPSRISSILTTQLKARLGNAKKWSESMVESGTFSIVPNITPADDLTVRRVVFDPKPTICSESYINYPTSTGAVLYAQKDGDWAAYVDNTVTGSGANSRGGKFYQSKQGYQLLYKNIISANPFEWKAVTRLNPFFSSSPFISSDVTSGFSRENVVLYTGLNQVETQTNYLGNTANIGEYGNSVVIMNELPYSTRDVKVLQPNGQYNADEIFVFSMSATPVKTKFLSTENYQVVVTNLLFDGLSNNEANVVIDAYATTFDELQKHATSSNDVPSHGTDEYFDSTYVNFRTGRLDDELSWPAYSLPNSLGANVFLANHYMSYLYDQGTLPTGVLATTTDSGSYIGCLIKVKNPSAPGFTTVTTITQVNYEATDKEESSNYAASCDIPVYRFFPRAVSTRITASNLYNERCTWLKGIRPNDPNSKYSTRPVNMSFEEYETLFNLAYSKHKGGLGIIPIFDTEHPNPNMRKIPFIGLISLGTKDNGGVGETFPLPQEGEYISVGSTPSFLQNKLSMAVTTQQTLPTQYIQGLGEDPADIFTIDHTPNEGDIIYTDVVSYAPCIQVGAVDPSFNFDENFARFSLQKLHTPQYAGNNVFQLGSTNPNQDAATIIESMNSKPAAISLQYNNFLRWFGDTNYIGVIVFDPDTPAQFTNAFGFPDIVAENSPYPVLSAQAGVGILKMGVYDTNNALLNVNKWSYTLFDSSLLNKLGFDLNQIIPLAGCVGTQFNSWKFNQYVGAEYSIYLQQQNMVSPVTTNAEISSSEAISFVRGFTRTRQAVDPIPINFYNLGIPLLEASTQANTDAIYAVNLPSKASFPYLLLHSSIQQNCGFQYIGSPTNCEIPVIAQLLTNLQTDDFSFSFQSSFEFVVKVPYTISNIESYITFPNCMPAYPVLGKNSGVVYRIDKLGIPPSISEKKDNSSEN